MPSEQKFGEIAGPYEDIVFAKSTVFERPGQRGVWHLLLVVKVDVLQTRRAQGEMRPVPIDCRSRVYQCRPGK